MSSTTSIARTIGLAVACATLLTTIPTSTRAQGARPEVKQQSMQVTAQGIAEQLGAKISPRESEEMQVGASLTGALKDPTKLAAFGITGMHADARVTAFRSAPDRLRVEVDELEPELRTQKATLKIDERGRLTVVKP
jgi:hypothetical protein